MLHKSFHLQVNTHPNSVNAAVSPLSHCTVCTGSAHTTNKSTGGWALFLMPAGYGWSTIKCTWPQSSRYRALPLHQISKVWHGPPLTCGATLERHQPMILHPFGWCISSPTLGWPLRPRAPLLPKLECCRMQQTKKAFTA